MDLTEYQLDSELMYDGGFLKVRKDQARLPNDQVHTREYVEHPGAVAVLALQDNGHVILERQFRYAPRREFVEIPAGKIDYQEHILDTAKRELLEETGYRAQEWQHLTTAWPCIGYADERIEYFVATGLTLAQQQLDEGELIEVFDLPLQQAMTWIKQGKINDSKTMVGLFWLEKYLTDWSR